MAVPQGVLEEYTNKCENHTMYVSQIAHLAIVAVRFARCAGLSLMYRR